MANVFALDAEEYQRSIDPVGDWIKQTAYYASKIKGRPLEECIEHLRKKLRNGEIKPENPTVVCFVRGENGDREKTTMPLMRYINEVKHNNEILVPTLTSFSHPSVKPSLLVEYLDMNVALRKKYKKIAQKFESEGNVNKYKYFNNQQDSAKRGNNAVSGGFVSEGSVIQNPTSHSALTSTIRMITSLSNASNERLIEGTRHYASEKTVINNVLSICAETDQSEIHQVIQKYGLVFPTLVQTMDCINRSFSLYSYDSRALARISELVMRLTPEERAAVVYTGDLYHLRVLNPDFMRKFITQLSRRGDATPHEDVVNKINQFDDQVLNYACQINIDILEGKGKKYEELPPEHAYMLYNTCLSIARTIEVHKDFIKAFFLTKNSPPTVATIPSMLRRAVVLSDTDSTMFSVDGWLDWYFGGLRFDQEGYAVGGAVMYLATQSIIHILALFSANMNVERKRLFSLAMKPEYVFPVFAQTAVAKHYYTAIKVKEGNVFKNIKMEIKGVHMKDSTVPSNIISGAAKEMKAIIETVMEGKKISLVRMLDETARIEQEIMTSIYRGETKYLKRTQIKEASSYKLEGDKSPYQFYTLWREAFESTYGSIPEPPYDAVTIPLKLDNKTAVDQWLSSCPNKAFSTGFRSWMVKNNKVLIANLPLPYDHCRSHGVPKELKAIIDTRKIVLALTKSYRNILGSLGYYSKRDLLIIEQHRMENPNETESLVLAAPPL